MITITSIAGQLTAAVAIGTLGGYGTGEDVTRALLEAVSNPSLCYVPIYSSEFQRERIAEISTSMIMSQAEGKKQFVTDNTAPHPRVWTMTGYLRSLIPYLERSLLFKPTILLQKFVLDQAMLSGEAVPFKTNDGEIVDVLISRLVMIDTPQSQSSVKIMATVQEIPYLTAADQSLEELSTASKSSVPVQQIATIGAATVIAATVQIVGALK